MRLVRPLWAPLLLGSAFSVLSSSCTHQQQPPPAAASPATSAEVPAQTAPPAPAQPQSASPPEAPKRMPYANPTDEALGTLPEDVGLPAGTPAPALTLPDINGKPVDMRELATHGPLMVVFYRGGWCPYCNFQIHELTEAYPEFHKRQVTPVAISVDRIEEGAKTQATYKIPFPVISDPDLVAHQAYRVVQHVDDETIAKLKNYGIDIEISSGRTHHNIAVPSVFLVDRAGTIVWSHAGLDYKERPSANQLLGVIDRVLK